MLHVYQEAVIDVRTKFIYTPTKKVIDELIVVTMTKVPKMALKSGM